MEIVVNLTVEKQFTVNHFSVTAAFMLLLTFSAFSQKKAEKSWYEKALMKIENENYQGALADLDKAIEAEPGNADAFFKRGFIKAQQLDHRGALQDFNKAIELNPRQAAYYAERGVARLNLNDRDGACDDLKKAAGMGEQSAKELAYEYCP